MFSVVSPLPYKLITCPFAEATGSTLVIRASDPSALKIEILSTNAASIPAELLPSLEYQKSISLTPSLREYKPLCVQGISPDSSKIRLPSTSTCK